MYNTLRQITCHKYEYDDSRDTRRRFEEPEFDGGVGDSIVSILKSRHGVQRDQLAHIKVTSASLSDSRTFPLVLILVSLYTNWFLAIKAVHHEVVPYLWSSPAWALQFGHQCGRGPC
jgi:hypothetical protein